MVLVYAYSVNKVSTVSLNPICQNIAKNSVILRNLTIKSSFNIPIAYVSDYPQGGSTHVTKRIQVYVTYLPLG